MKKLYFIRHGQTDMNVAGLFSGHTDARLTDEGKLQAKKAGQATKNLGIDLIVSSPLSRAYQTAKIVAKEIGYPTNQVITNQLLVERFFGGLEGQPYSPDLNIDGISDLETDDMLVTRAHEALAWINAHQANHILVVSHGSFGRALRSILKEDYPMSHPERLNNAELVCWVEED
jgi:probable phosphoglycerate mutase